MFLLILGANLIPESFETIYIPLCFYLYDRSVPNVLPSSVFTFHYVSTYTKRTDNRSDKRVDLHSTMFLLIRRDIRPWQSEGIIYIPLCFYLYYSVKVPFLWSGFIYIPLCFYLYSLQHSVRLAYTLFTFHYVSTYTNGQMQYLIVEGDIYIPLCFYLYYRHDVIHTGAKWFTFHYVSTYTLRHPDTRRMHLQFTFHYVSTYTVIPHFIYIQIMLYSVELKAAWHKLFW